MVKTKGFLAGFFIEKESSELLTKTINQDSDYVAAAIEKIHDRYASSM